jgi:hypothetical protein
MCVYKFDLNESKWSNFKLELPENLICVRVYTMLVCAGKLYAVISCNTQHGGIEHVVRNTYIMEGKEDVSKFDIKGFLFQLDFNTNMTVCTMQDRDTCILANRVGVTEEEAKFFCV